MPRPPMSEEQQEAMRARILDAAHDILLRDGLGGLTSRAIGHALGIAHMTIFTYFENQAALLDALAAREMAPLQAQLESLEREAEHGDVAALMRAALALYPRFAAEHPDLFRLAWATPLPEGRGAELVRVRAQTHVASLARLVRSGIARGVFHAREPALAAAAVLSMVLAPPIIYVSGRIPTPEMRDALEAELLDAALLYLTRS